MEHNPKILSKGKAPTNPFKDLNGEMDFTMRLLFQYVNTHEAENYKDPLGWFVFKTTDHMTFFNKFPIVNYQGDILMGLDGTRYKVTKHPHNVNALGVLHKV